MPIGVAIGTPADVIQFPPSKNLSGIRIIDAAPHDGTDPEEKNDAQPTRTD